MAVKMPVSDLARACVVEPEDEWPDEMFIIARCGDHTKRVPITKDHYYGVGSHGAPITGQWLLGVIDRLRQWKP